MRYSIVFATNNDNKVSEINALLPDGFKIMSLKQAGIDIDIPEPFDTLEENAKEKSRVIFELTKKNCFSEDTGLEVNSLNGSPGVRSARYAGVHGDSEANIKKLLDEMSSISERSARFRTVISLVLDKKNYLFEGICEGRIIDTPRGTEGFGYDPVFIPHGSDKTFAEMNMDEKNKFSHRKKATMKLINFLKEINGQD